MTSSSNVWDLWQSLDSIHPMPKPSTPATIYMWLLDMAALGLITPRERSMLMLACHGRHEQGIA